MLHDALEVIGRMLEPGRTTRATYEGEHASVIGAINLPKPIQEHGMPIMVGGNGPKVTWRLAARYADELNLDGMSPDEVREALPTIRARCEEIGRDPDTLAVSVHAWWGDDTWSQSGERRVELLRQYADLGVSRVIGLIRSTADDDEALEELAEDADNADVELD
jgi:alkanesulfonate monooxygenase SsuD/methylene tetrahydromethanopterin reductase-like flavin-dependent oxidoreductase (luciferase family)